ncbi:unnamed protein product [Rotaria socialis]|uniref:Uncharacterized protein n=1 Tax=Rotaria socialis TaxID=392032 RepID=A0A817SQ96_9BILA|nr:unnamed protein product [Rotaria socialis]CAF3756981.1 unnamed protein product [Rotaria socialis]CAF4865075.1 unnamed protein product [Rotaria socialis]CAF4902837.1 unnamed protein product [Rotaria socialis]
MSQSNGLQCRVCKENGSSCLFAQHTRIRDCENYDDLCYSWFYRSGSDVGVLRNCLSVKSPEYNLIKKLIGNTERTCRKRLLGLDCFTMCSTDLCN